MNLKNIVILSLLALSFIVVGCGVTVDKLRFDEVKAVGWTEKGAPIALAQEVTFEKEFYLVSPEGGGTFEHVSHGPVVLLTDGSRKKVDLGIEGQRSLLQLVPSVPIIMGQRLSVLQRV